jgi:DNA-binding SARP family transcriptional activator
LLNAFAFTRGGVEISLSVPAQRVLAFLALQERPVSREYVAATLWWDASQRHAAGSLRSALFKLRRACGEAVETSGASLSVTRRLAVDVQEAMTWARTAMEPAADDADLRGMAFAGDILPDWYDDWVAFERERFRELRLHALEAVSARLTEAGRFGEAMDVALAAVAGEPLRESAHRAVIGVHLAEGNRAAALDAYGRFKARLDRDLGLAPSARMRELLAPITAW